ncbi:MAG: 3-phosphoshikimate 1-carboxyvinyltransferase [Polyangiaceae bacterium]|nr:3-phosphoshikimate 1-carboxyvinyltransferase [Polyangiaceae bacterium]MCW5791231.1 3-phosphoshikimate 1-carboxyvinyltransferase [Polyangiaceae bacterium]
MTTLIVSPAERPLTGSVPVPSDKSIGHRALIFAALSRGACRITGFSYGGDNVATLRALRQLGVRIEDDERGNIVCHGVGLSGLRAPQGVIDCGNSGTSMRLFAGLLAAQPFEAVLVGDESLSRRPMRRVTAPLEARGGRFQGQPNPEKPGEITAPLRVLGVAPGERLGPLEYTLPVASAQVKSALLLSGLFASGPTLVSEPLVSRDHTERLMEALRLPVETVGGMVSLHPPADPSCIEPFELCVPGDFSAAAFVLTAGLLVPGSTVTVRDTGLNHTRTGLLDLMRAMGAPLGVEPHGSRLGESQGQVSVSARQLRASNVGGELAVRAIDEIPIACALAARARGQSRFMDLAELRVKESDRIAEMVKVLGAFGVSAEETPDGLVVDGQPDGQLTAASLSSRGDHRIAMTAAVLGLLGDGPTRILDADCIATSFPRFVGTLRALGAEVEVAS